MINPPITFKFPQLLTDLANIYYLTGFTAIPEKRHDTYLLITPGKYYLFTNSLYGLQAEKLAGKNPKLKFRIISGRNPLHTELKKLLAICKYKTIYIETTVLSASEYLYLADSLKPVTVVPWAGDTENLRTIKSDDEIRRIRIACSLTDACFRTVKLKIKPGNSEADVVFMIENFARSRNCGLAFEPLVAFGPNSAYPHYIRQNRGRILQENDVILLDFGLKYGNYCSDMTRMAAVGRIPDLFRKSYDALLQLHQLLHSRINRELDENHHFDGSGLDAFAKDYLARNFQPFSHSLGHGIGLDIHEDPRLTDTHDFRLSDGMVFSLEPALYFQGKFGIRIEDTVCINNNRLKQLTLSTKKLHML